ncbi:unnamed protein product [Moneuplotes crassus]|uniref:Peptidase A1 domain-containing protein n=1 Tax=Euplotes crassus TaxID=5936 RepID=A0AAD1UDD3_EUPCR|nr:unnamed protein product [Moneuplotes crassus]
MNGTSSILFGGYDNELIKNDKALSWVDLKNSSYWTVDIDNFKYDGTELSLRTSSARIDTGISYILLESRDFSSLWTQFKKGRTCGYISGSTQLACTCDSVKDFKDIKFKLGDHDMKISSSAYIKFYNSTSSNNTCAFLIGSYSGSSGGIVYLGYTFMREYYIYHDVTAQRVGLYRKGSSGHPSVILTIITLVVLIVSF